MFELEETESPKERHKRLSQYAALRSKHRGRSFKERTLVRVASALNDAQAWCHEKLNDLVYQSSSTGRILYITDMTNSHIRNAISKIVRDGDTKNPMLATLTLELEYREYEKQNPLGAATMDVDRSRKTGDKT